ncbi:MAG: sigma 54-interacting transcriptional regulator [Nitrospiraceae bacterium]
MSGALQQRCRDSSIEWHRTLLEVSEAIASHRDLTELFRDLAQRLPRVVQVNFVALSLHDPARNVMRLHTLQANVPADIVGGHEEPVEETPAGLVWQTQQPLLVPDLAEERRWPKVTQCMQEDGINSFCEVPLTTALRRVGAMGFASLKKEAYDEADVEFLQQIGQQVAVAVDNVLHHQELTRDRDRLRLLLEVSESIASHRDLTALFRDLAKRLPSVVQFEFIALILHDPVRNVMKTHTLGTAEGESIPPGFELPIEESAGGWVLSTQQPLVVPCRDKETRFPKVTALLREIGVQSYCLLPLTSAVRRLGAIGFGSSTPCAFGGAELDFLQQVATQVAVAVDNVLHDESAQSAQQQLASERDRLRLLLEVSESIALHRDLDKLFHDLAQRLPRIVPFDYINLILHDPTREVMRLHILAVPVPSTIKPGLELPVDESPGGLVWKTQQPLVVEDVALESRFPKLMPMLRENGVQSFCAVPLTTALRRLGAMGFGSLQRRTYQEAELNFMQQVAKQVAVAVDNVLHDESAQSAQRQLTRERDRVRLLLEVNNAVVSHLGLDDLFPAVSACLRKVIKHDGSSLVLFEPETRQYRVQVLDFTKNTSFIEEGQADPQCKGPSGVAITTRKPAVFTVQDLKNMASESKVCERLLGEGVKSLCSVPLLAHDRVRGALNVGRRHEDAFAPDEIDLLSQVAQQVAIAVENALAYREITELKDKLAKEKLYLEDEIRTEFNFEEIVGDSPALKQVLKQVEIVASTGSTVLILGETGTGKELLARAIHNSSERRGRTFVKMNCAAIPTGLLESELFGHEKGAFTGAIASKVGRFELAHQGTLFLDEIGDIPVELQSKLLRVLQEQEFERLGSTKTIRVDIRLVAATNRDLVAMVADKQFRNDLYYRLNVFPIVSPPLRERQEDITLLVRYFAQKFARRMNKHIETITTETMTALSRYHWPGNVRELENLIERAVILSQGTELHVPLAELKAAASDGAQPVTTLEAAEREHILRALQAAKWIIGGPSGAAAKLGMKRTTLQSKMQKLSISRPS